MKIGEIWANDSIAILIVDKLENDFWKVAPFGIYSGLENTVLYIRSEYRTRWANNTESGNNIRKFYERLYENR